MQQKLFKGKQIHSKKGKAQFHRQTGELRSDSAPGQRLSGCLGELGRGSPVQVEPNSVRSFRPEPADQKSE